jgi:hypothetical protein
MLAHMEDFSALLSGELLLSEDSPISVASRHTALSLLVTFDSRCDENV